MAARRRALGAAVDVGSNSVHLLVAEIEPAGLRYLHDESVLLGLGDALSEMGRLPAAAIDRLVGELIAYRALATATGARTVTFVGTHPIRSAVNRSDVCTEVERAVGIPLDVLSELDEGRLTYLGATAGRQPAEALLVTDIGGGSTEVIVGGAGRPLRVASLPSGSARLSNGIVLHDPPTPSELDRLRLAAKGLVRELAPGPVGAGLFVGGTATNLAKLVPLSRVGLEQAHGLLTTLTQAELVNRYTVNPRRARQLPAGAALVEALLECFGLEAVDTSQASLRDGVILAAGRFGAGWLAGAARLVGDGTG